MAVSYWPPLKAATPLLRRSRAFSLLQPEKPAARIKSAAKAEARRAIRGKTGRAEMAPVTDDAYVIEASIPAERDPENTGAAPGYSLPPCEGQCETVQRPLSKSGVSRPTDAIPEVCMTSITLATTPNSTGPSPRIKATRDARCLKTSSSLVLSESQATGSWLMRSVPSAKI